MVGELVADRSASHMNEDLDALVYEFLRTFTRFEYALKATTEFCRRGRFDDAAPNWTRFAESAPVREVLGDPVEAGLTDAVAYIVAHPPRTQVVENGVLAWSDRPPSARSRSGRVLELVRRVRNNLFHGAKGNQHWVDPERTEALLSHSLTILHGCRDASEGVAAAYDNGVQRT